MIKNEYNYQGPLNGAYAIQDKFITNELKEFATSTYEWRDFFVADGKTDHSKRFLTSFKYWVRKSNNNNIIGIDQFPYATQTNGTSEAFTMFMMRHNKRKFKFFKGDFMMHKIASNVMGVDWEWIKDTSSLSKGDAVIISCPFSDTGDKHEHHDTLIQICNQLEIPVLVDMAYFGMCSGININLDQPCIEEVTFSLGKTFPLIGARAGIRFQKEEIDDPVLFANQHGIVNNFAAMMGQFAMEVAGPDYIADKYKTAQINVCRKLDLKPTNCILFALSNKLSDKTYNRGNDLTRLCISKLIEEEYEQGH